MNPSFLSCLQKVREYTFTVLFVNQNIKPNLFYMSHAVSHFYNVAFGLAGHFRGNAIVVLIITEKDIDLINKTGKKGCFLTLSKVDFWLYDLFSRHEAQC